MELDIDVKDINKFTKGLDRYDQSTLEKYRTFLKQLDNVIRKIGFSQEYYTLNLSQVVNRRIELSEKSNSILTFILSDALEGIASEVTTQQRDNNDPLEILRILSDAWPDESDKAKGSTIRQQLLRTKYQAGETIQSYNQKYRALFNEAIRLNRYQDDMNAIDDYLHSFPTNTSIVESAIQVTLSRNFTSLPSAMSFMSSVIRSVRPNGIIVKNRDQVMQTSERKRNNQPQQRRKLLPIPINACLRCGYESCNKRDCSALDQYCRFCKKKGHLLRACRKLHKKVGNPFPDLKENVKSAKSPVETKTDIEKMQEALEKVNFVGCSIEKEVNITTLIKEQAGVDTMASCTILNDKRYFINLDSRKDLISFNQKEVKSVPSGTAEILLFNDRNECVNLVLRASYIPSATNLLCCHDLLQSGFEAFLSLENPYISNRKKNFSINLTWNNRLLNGCRILPAKEYINSVSYLRWHHRLAHLNPKATNKTIGITKPKGFDCYICQRMNLKNRNIRPSEWSYKNREELEVYEHIQVDIMYHKDTRLGNKYTLFVIDVKSRLLKTQPLIDLTSKEVMSKMVHTFVQVQRKPNTITTDRGTCFTSTLFTDFLQNQGINLLFCAPFKHQQNPFAERVIGTIRRKALALLNYSRLSKYFFADAVSYAQQLYNITWHST